MHLALFERMELLGKAARVFLGMPVERSDKTGTAMLSEQYLLEQILRVRAARPKIRETFAGPKGKSDLSEKSDRGSSLCIANTPRQDPQNMGISK